MNKALQVAAIALGWTTLAMSGLVEPMVGRGKHLALYHWTGSAGALFGPVLLLFAVVWVAAFLLLLSSEAQGRWRAGVWTLLLLLLPLPLATAVKHMFGVPTWFHLPPPWVVPVLLGVVLLAWRPSWEPQFERGLDLAARGLLLLAFTGTLVLLELGYFWWSARTLNAPHPLHTQAAVARTAPHPRVIWIVLDELSFQQTYGDRYPGLQLPAFDALASGSTVFTKVLPAGYKTEQVLPSLITGRPVLDIRATAEGQLLLRAKKDGPWAPFAAGDTVFQDALNQGYRTGIAGWYNPYCRLLPEVLDRCFWTLDSSADNGLSSSGSFRSNLLMALESLLGHDLDSMLFPKARRPAEQMGTDPAGHLVDYRELMSASDSLLADPSVDFLLLHLPVPHPEGIFSRQEGNFQIEHTTYLDNLVLADRSLAEIRSRLERAGAWDAATVVLMGDHSWRVDTMWRGEPDHWTAEEERATHGGHFDDRPAYVVKLPQQGAGSRIDRPFEAIRTRALLDGLLSRRIRTPEDLAAFVQQSTTRQGLP